MKEAEKDRHRQRAGKKGKRRMERRKKKIEDGTDIEKER
jgi:hypothetical protein